jgi:hypothetical protein
VVLLALVPLDIAHALYGRAAAASRRGDAAAARANAESAANWDPAFPLYGARTAWLTGEHDMARAAAARAVASPPLWLEAGAMSATAQLPAAAAALQRACSLDPLGAPAPMHLAISQAESNPDLAARSAARALLAEPRYLAARFWIGRESLRAAALAEAERWPGVDVGWKASLLELAKTVDPSPSGPAARLGLDLDLEPALSFSLYAFRRAAWPATLAPIDVDAEAARAITIPPASTLSTTRPDAFAPNC